MMLSLILLIASPWLAFCMPPPTSKTLPPPPTTTPPMCTCSDGTQIAPGEWHSISDCKICVCDGINDQYIIADCLPSNCVDPIDVPGQCCDSCPNGENCLAEFIDFNGTARSEIISVNDGIVDFGAAQCKCDYENYYGEPKASCEQVTTTPPPTTPPLPTTTPLPTTIPAMCTCPDGTQVPPGESHSISDCHTCYCDKHNLQAYQVIAESSVTVCVDPVLTPGQCCPHCPNGENCLAEFIDFYGTPRSEIISVYGRVVSVEAAQCKCNYENFYGEPKASCEQVTTSPPPTTTPIPTTTPPPVTGQQTTVN